MSKRNISIYETLLLHAHFSLLERTFGIFSVYFFFYCKKIKTCLKEKKCLLSFCVTNCLPVPGKITITTVYYLLFAQLFIHNILFNWLPFHRSQNWACIEITWGLLKQVAGPSLEFDSVGWSGASEFDFLKS